MKKNNKKLIIGIILIIINLYSVFIGYNRCVSNGTSNCSLFKLEDGILYTLGYCSFLIAGLVLITLFFIDSKSKNKLKKEKTITSDNKNFQDKFTSLKQLKELLDEKIITKEEFEKEKNIILNNKNNK